MRHRLLTCFPLILMTTHAKAADSIDGKWRLDTTLSQGVDRIVMEFKVSGSKLTGSITRTFPAGLPSVAIDGLVSGNKIEFTVMSADGARAIKFSGKIAGDEIAFAREVKGTGGGDGLYGQYGPVAFTVKRMK